MTTSAWPSSSDITPVTRSRISFCSGEPSTSMTLPLPPRTRLGDPLEAVVEQAAGVDRLGERLDLGEEVVAHPRDGGELHPVGLLVEADPEPEVGGVGAELALDVDDVGRHQQQPAGRLVERVELAEHLGGEEAEQQPDLAAGDPGADRQRQPGRRALLLLRAWLDDRLEHDRERLGVGLHPALPVDDEHRCGALGGGQPGELADQPGRAVGAGAELGHRVGGLGRRHDRSRSGDPAPEGDRERPSRPSSLMIAATLRVRDRQAGAHGVRRQREQRQAPSAPARLSRSCCGVEGVAFPDPVGGEHERHRRPRLVGRDAGERADPAEGAGLGPHPADAGGRRLVEAEGQRPGEAADRQPGQRGTEVGVVGAGRDAAAPRAAWRTGAGSAARGRCRRGSPRRRAGTPRPASVCRTPVGAAGERALAERRRGRRGGPAPRRPRCR